MQKRIFSIFKEFKISHLLCLLLGIAILVAPVSSAFSAEPKIKVMTRNVYLGADIFKVVDAAQNPDPANQGLDVPIAVAEVFQTMLYTNFPARAEALADEIARYKPQAVGLQEVATFYTQTPGDFLIGNPTQAEDLVIDFYTVLDAALKARGLEYEAFTNKNSEVELPMLTGFNSSGYPTFDDVRMVMHNVVLVRKGYAATEVLINNYSTNVGLDLGGVWVEFTRGYVIVDVDIKGEIIRFVGTHLEVRSAPDSVFRVVQSAQMQELIGTLDSLSSFGSKPTIIVGDLNSSPTDVPGYGLHPVYGWLPYVPPYMLAVGEEYGAKYLDSWLLQDKHDEGYTSGFDELVSDPTVELGSRIDHILLDPDDRSVDKVSSTVVGNEVIDMVPNPLNPGSSLWPSDHAGVVSKIKLLLPY